MEVPRTSFVSPEDRETGEHLPLISPSEAAVMLAKQRRAYDALLDEIREGNRIRASGDTVFERDGSIVRIASQGE